MFIGFIESILAVTAVIIRSNKNLVLIDILLGLVRIILVSVIAVIINNAIKAISYNNLINLFLTFFLMYPNWFCFRIVIGNGVMLIKVIIYSVLVLIILYVMFLYIK